MQLIEGPNDQDAAPEEMPVQATSDETLIALWLAGKADRTRRAYQDDVTAFLRFVDKSLRQITLADLVAWGDTLAEMAPASRARKLGAVKSLAAFGHRIGYLRRRGSGVPLEQRRASHAGAGPPHRQTGRSRGRNLSSRLGALAPACPRQPRIGSRRTGLACAGDTWPCLGRHYRPLPTRAAQRQLGALPPGLATLGILVRLYRGRPEQQKTSGSAM
jgi:hypothetical protein